MPGKERAIQISDCMARDGGLARGVILAVTPVSTPQYGTWKTEKGFWRRDACHGRNMRDQNGY
ncbi:MAG: hypothetical protein ACYDHG_13980 [Desulfomonilaceae bacterium]